MNNINIIKEKYNKFIVEGDRIIFNKIIYDPRVIQSVKLFKPMTSYEFAIAPLEIVPDDKHQLPIDIKNIIFMNGAYISKDRLNYFISKAFSEERQRNERNERIREETMVKTLEFTENISIETYLGKALDLLCCCQKRS
jgi:UDP-galactopyranose mutase